MVDRGGGVKGEDQAEAEENVQEGNVEERRKERAGREEGEKRETGRDKIIGLMKIN